MPVESNERRGRPFPRVVGAKMKSLWKPVRNIASVLLVAFSFPMAGPLTPAHANGNNVMIGVADFLPNVTQPSPCKNDVLEEQAMETWQTKANTFMWVYQNWDLDNLDLDFQCLTAIWQVQHAIPMILFQPPRGLSDANVDCARLINTRAFDAYLVAWSARMKVWLQNPGGTPRRVFVDLLPEANLNNRWCWHKADDRDVAFRAAYRHVVKVIRDQDTITRNPAPITDPLRLQWGWLSYADGFRSDLYPDYDNPDQDSHVDWVGIDTRQCAETPGLGHFDPNNAVHNAVATAGSLGKPIWLDQIAVSITTVDATSCIENDQTDKNTWLAEYFEYVRMSNGVKLIVQWNNNTGNGSFGVFSRDGEGGIMDPSIVGDEHVMGIPVGYSGYSQYRLGIESSAFLDLQGAAVSDSLFLGA